MEDYIRIRLTTAEKERLKEIASERGMTISQYVLDSLKLKRKKKSRKPILAKSNSIVKQAA